MKKLRKISYDVLMPILPVMVGVYLGFLANNWNESRKAEQLSDKAITSLIQEVEHNLSVIENSILSEYPKLERNTVYAMENRRGFSKFGEFMTFYKTYIENRDKYPMLEDFYPEIIEWIGRL